MATDPSGATQRSEFATTHWSVILSAGDGERCKASRALAQLCEMYWYPLYAYIRRQVADNHEAQDFTQAFFAHLLDKGFVAAADPERGRFRAFLLTACKRFLINEWHKGRTAKRGGGRRPLSLDFESGESKYSLIAVDPTTAEQLYERQWAVTLLERVIEQLRLEYIRKNRLPYFEMLKQFLAGASHGGSYVETRSRTKSATYLPCWAARSREKYGNCP
jgi:RNA polymerase sigma-70 factor (ECF subfamily)